MPVVLSTEQRKVFMSRLSENLPVFRAKLSISQENLADIIDVTRQTISAFESNQREMTWSIFLSLVLVFFRNQKTKRLLVALDIYTPELDAFLAIKDDTYKKIREGN